MLARLRHEASSARLGRWAHELGKTDLLAGLTVAVVLIPQSLAYAMLVGVAPVLGLYAAMVPPLIYALVGSSRFMAIGPVALTSLLIASGLEGLAEPGSDRWAELAILLSFEVGLLFVLLASVRAGFLVNFLGHPTILGFNAAAGLITAGSQLRSLFGVPKTVLPELSATKPWPVLLQLEHTHVSTLVVASLALVGLIAAKRWLRRWPYYLVICALAMLATWALDLPARGVAVVGETPRGLPIPSLPRFERATLVELLPAALSIVVIGYASSITVVKALAAKARDSTNPDRELWALAACNIGSGLFGSFPVSSGLARSMVVAESGAKTRWAGAIAALVVLAALLTFGPVFQYLPRAVLAAVVIMAVVGLVDVRGIVEAFRTRRADGLTAIATFVATLVIGLEVGLALGVALALGFFVVRTTRPHSAELGRIPGTTVYRNVERFAGLETCPQIGMLRIDAPLYYANAQFLEDRIHAMFAARPRMKLLALDCSSVSDMDATAEHALRRAVEALRTRGNDLHLIGVLGPVRDLLARSGLSERLGAANMHRSWADAGPQLVAAVERKVCQQQCRSAAFPGCTLIPRSALVRSDAELGRFMPQI